MKRNRFTKIWPLKKTCEICHKPFLCYPPNARGKYCGSNCKRLAGNIRASLWRTKNPDKVVKMRAHFNKIASIKKAEHHISRLNTKIKKLKASLL